MLKQQLLDELSFFKIGLTSDKHQNLKIKYVPYTSVKKWSVMLLYICSLFENNPSSSDLESIFLKRCIDQEKAMLQIWYHPELSIRAIQVYGKIWVVEWGHNICDLSKKKKKWDQDTKHWN